MERWQYVPDGKEGLAVQFLITNSSDTEKSFVFRLTGHTDLMPVWLGERTGMKDGNDVAEFSETTRMIVPSEDKFELIRSITQEKR